MPKTKYPIFKCLHRGEKGFTLIELLIVVAILAIIAAVVIPNIGAFMVTGRLAAANTEAENVKTASLAYYADNEGWPTDSIVLETDEYVAGTLGAVYSFNVTSGWLTSADPTGRRWDNAGIVFVQADSNAHGKWERG